MYIYSPPTVRRIEDVIRYEWANQWRMAPTWQYRILGVEKPTGETSTIQFREPTVKIYRLGPQGGGMIFDPTIRKQMKYEAEPVGNGLELFRRQMAKQEAVGIQTAGEWAEEAGMAAAYYDVRGTVGLMHSGLGVNPVVTAFDGLPLFSKVHPIGGASDLTYSNEHNGMDFSAENLAVGWAYIAQLRHGGDAPRRLTDQGLIVVLPTNYFFRGQQALNAESYTDVLNVQAAASNTLKTAYGFQEPIIDPEFAAFPDTWFLCVPAGKRPTDSGLVMVQDEPFSINSFTHLDQVTLAQKQTLEYHQRAWIAFAAGQPYYVHRFRKSGTIDPYMQQIKDNF